MDDIEKICIAYCGSGVDNGSMDVHDLAPALLAFADFIIECNKVLTNNDSAISVKVDADFQKGSFEIHLELIKTFMQQVQTIFGESRLSLEETLALMGITGTVGKGLISFVKWIRNRVIERVEPDKDEPNVYNVYVMGDGDNKIQINSKVIELYQSVSVRQNLEKAVSPLGRDGIDRFEIRKEENHRESVVSSVSKDEMEYFKAPDVTEAQINISEQTAFVKLVKISFEQNMKWQLILHNEKISADIKDEEFYQKIDHGEISFAKGDVLRVRMIVKQTMKPDGSISARYTVMKVEDIIKRPQQVQLPL